MINAKLLLRDVRGNSLEHSRKTEKNLTYQEDKRIKKVKVK